MARYVYDWLFYVILWVAVTLFFNFIFISISWTVVEVLDVSSQVQSNSVFGYMISNFQYLEGFMFGFLFGTATFGINLAIDRTSIHKFSFGKIIIIKTLLYFFSVALIFVLMSGIILNSGMAPFTKEQYREYILSNPMPSSYIAAIIGYFVISTLLINYVALVSKKFGPGQMINIFFGKYNRPKTENRIFMFLDMKDSTTNAEKLGHIIFSKLLQQCFLDLNKLVPDSGAEIYQYVGDEVVLTWNIKNYNSNFIKPMMLFFDFKERLELKTNYYKSKFGVVPEFKAGVNAGVVTVAEIGDIKKEIAYHGDVVNTASRLRGACNEFKKDLLASEYVIKNISEAHEYKVKEIGEVTLKGKLQSMKVFSVEGETRG